MADRVKYFLLGVLFLVVAGVIAYDKWNPAGEPKEIAERPQADTGGDFDMSVQSSREVLTVPGSSADTSPVVPPASSPAPAAAEQAPAPERAVVPQPATPRETPKPAAKSPETPKPPPAPDKTHVIRKGETLEAIAIKYYGTREGIEWIVDANRLGNANRIFANQKLVIPARKEMAKEGGPGGTTAKRASDVPSRYRVKANDGNLYAICRRIYGREGQGARVSRVMEMNHLYSADVNAGTILILPPR